MEEGEIYCLKIKETSIIICFCYAIDIINVDDNYPYFKEDVEEGLIFATDLGGNVYYYGKGREGLRLIYCWAGDGNFYDEATKFASTFEEFFIEGIGIDILKSITDARHKNYRKSCGTIINLQWDSWLKSCVIFGRLSGKPDGCQRKAGVL